jgi:hypothetical protein
MAGICELFERTGTAMTQRTCGNCRWWQYHRDWSNKQVGQCRQNASGLPEVYNTDFCGQWADKTITPEQEERRELVRRFAVALLTRHGDSLAPHDAWDLAMRMADAEPKGV